MFTQKKNLKLGIIAILGFFVYYFLNIYTDFSIPCLFHKLTGFYCPGCGITRLLFSLIHLDFYQAFRYNPLVFILLILSMVYWLFKLILKKFSIDLIIPNFVWYILLFIVIIYGIMRNIPFFNFLIPTEL